MVVRRGLGLITSSNFFVPQVNPPGSMAGFVRPASAPARAFYNHGQAFATQHRYERFLPLDYILVFVAVAVRLTRIVVRALGEFYVKHLEAQYARNIDGDSDAVFPANGHCGGFEVVCDCEQHGG